MGRPSVDEREAPTFEGEHQTFQGDLKVSLLPGLPSITLHRESLYVPNDQWKKYLADEKTCPGGERTDLPLTEQADDHGLPRQLRARATKPHAGSPSVLNGSSLAKAERVVRCREFKHAACGLDPASDARAAGYEGRSARTCTSPTAATAPRGSRSTAGSTRRATARPVPPEWRTQGIAVRKLDRFGQYHDAALWVNEFGTG